MELLSPAGNVEKLRYAYMYGADSAYIGLKNFSLRVKADNFYEEEYKEVMALKKEFPGKKLYCALNILFSDKELDDFITSIPYFKLYPIDAFIVQDLGVVEILQKYFPGVALHLSTQASCVNSRSARMYQRLGFKRIVLGREASINDIKRLHEEIPEVELEAFCHGAMCIAYSGRCLLSAYLSGRSAQKGECSHPCRWNYSLQERQSKEVFPVLESDNWLQLLSSRDLCMVEHLTDFINAGVKAIKIEGRMKSLYYVAMVTEAYRKALDAIEGKIEESKALPFIAELNKVSSRKFTTGFYYDKREAEKTCTGEADSPYILVATVIKKLDKKEEDTVLNAAIESKIKESEYEQSLHPLALEARTRDKIKHPARYHSYQSSLPSYCFYRIKALNLFNLSDSLEVITPNCLPKKIEKGSYFLVDEETGAVQEWTSDSHDYLLYTNITLEERAIIRIKDKNYTPSRAEERAKRA